MKSPPSRRSFVKQSAVVGTGLITFGSVALRAGSSKRQADAPVLHCGDATPTSIDIEICAPKGAKATGIPAGFSLQWMTAAEYAAKSKAWCEAGFSGQAARSRYSLRPGDCVTVQISKLKLDNGASTSCSQPLVPGTDYVFRAFAHADSTLTRSDFTPILKCVTRSAVTSPFRIPVNSADPLLLRAIAVNGQIVDYFGTRDSNGVPLSVNLIEIHEAADDGSSLPLRYFLDADHRPVRMYSSDRTQFNLTWLTATQIALTVVTPNGQTQVNTFVDLAGVAPAGVTAPTTKPATAPATFSATATNTAPRGGRRAVLRYEPLAPALSAKGFAAMAGQNSSVNVLVQGCGGLPTDGDVYVLVTETDADFTFLGRFPATRTSQGQYAASIPSGLAPSVNPGEICGTLAAVVGLTCDTVIENPGAPEFVCVALTAAVALVPDIGVLIAEEIATACARVMSGLELYCRTLGVSAGPGAPSLADLLCESDALDRTFTEEIRLIPAIVGLPGDVFGIPVRAPGVGPFPNLLVDLQTHTAIRSLTLNPPNPVVQQPYVATADIFCLPAGTVVTLSIIGTDGYADSVSTTINTTQESGTFSLFVPGALTAGIRDIDTVEVSLPTGVKLSRDAALVFG